MLRDGSSLTPQPGLEALLAYERTIVDKPDAVRARVLARARESLWRGDVMALESLGAPVWPKLLLTAAGSVALVATVAATLYLTSPLRMEKPAGSRPKDTAQAAPTDPPLAEQPRAIAATVPLNGGSSAVREDASPFAASVGPNPAHSRKTDVFDELGLLDRARRSDARGDYLSVLAIANSHARAYPEGRLAEEREVLRLKALVSLGRSRDVRLVAEEFRRQFPRSVLLPTIEAMLAQLR